MKSKVKSFYHQDTYTWTHVISCVKTKQAIIIDPVLDYNPNNANTSTQSVETVLAYINQQNLQLEYILETHAHADHLTAAVYLQEALNCKIAIGSHIKTVQTTFKEIFNFDDSFKTDGSQFGLLLEDGDVLEFGQLSIEVMHTPGHTNDSMSFVIENNVFIGDTLFSPDYGTARCDFPGGDAGKLYDSIQNIFSLGDDKQLYLCHDYPPNNRKPQASFSVLQQKQDNIHLQNTNKHAFVSMRNKRDASLNQPKLIIPAIQVNIRAGHFPVAESNGNVYLKIPINVLGKKTSAKD